MKKWFSTLMKRLQNERGVAIILVLSAISILTIAIAELSYSSLVNYKLAVNDKERLQAYYLAQSAVNLSKLLLQFNKDAEKMKAKAQGMLGDMATQPMYKMIPLSSEMLRGALSGLIPELSGAGEEGGDEGGTNEAAHSLENSARMIDKDEAKEFLDFEGDFLAEISEEQTRFDLNKIYRVVTSNKSYDLRQKLLMSILLLPQFEDILEEAKLTAADLTHALSDWVDENGVINDFDDVQRGSESSLYGDVDYDVKNGKFLTLSEMRLVAGMNDRLFQLLSPFVTVYSGNEKINLCYSENEDMARALLYHYINNSGCAQSIDYQDKERMDALVEAMMLGCPDVNAMAQAVNAKLGLTDLAQDEVSPDGQTTATGNPNAQTADSVPGCQFQLSSLLTADNNVFQIKGTGTVGDTQVSIIQVVDTTNQAPSKWPIHYYRVE